MPKYKKQLILSPRKFRADFRILTKNQRVQLRASFPKSELELLRQPVKWEVLYKDSKCKVVSTRASENTDFVITGELVFMLLFNDGRKIRLNVGDLSRRRIDKINRAIKKKRDTNDPQIEHDPRNV